MNITECVPLAGRGLVARRGHLVALTGGTDAGPDPLLTALTAVAYANGDGAALVLAATHAAAEHGGRPAWACAGVTAGEEVAILVHGEAVALVTVDGSPEAQVTASGSMIPVSGTFTGAVVTVRLVIGPPAPPDPRLWLEAGTVFGGGIVLTIKQEKPGNLITNDPSASVAATMRPAMEQAVGNMLLRPAGPVPAPPGVAPGEVYPEDVLDVHQSERAALACGVNHASDEPVKDDRDSVLTARRNFRGVLHEQRLEILRGKTKEPDVVPVGRAPYLR